MSAARRNAARAPGGRGLRLWIAGAVSCALIATIAVVAAGYDARETPREEPGVWVARESGQYARVNTDTGELDVVRRATEPSGVLQSGENGVVLSGGNGKAWAIDPADPVDLGEDEEDEDAAAEDTGEVATVSATEPGSGGAGTAAIRMPEGAREVLSAGRFVAVRTEAGAVYLGELEGDERASGALASADDVAARLSSLLRIEPAVDRPEASDDVAAETPAPEAAEYAATAIALAEDGRLAMYSSEEDAVRSYDAIRGEFVGDASPVPGRAIEEPQLALIGDAWVLLDAESGSLRRQGADAVALEIEGAPLLQASSAGDADAPALVADSAGLLSIAADGEVSRLVSANGAPARPASVGGTSYAAWVGAGSGTLWSSDGGERPLAVDDAAEDSGDPQPVFRSNGARAVLVETRTGMIWTLPDGEAIPLSQWSISDPPKEAQGTVVVDEVTEQVAPTAVDDAFGVRPGETVSLPVLLNDFDANKRDVLTIAPDSLSESPLPEGFGRLGLLSDAQSLTVRVDPDASGTATFRYRVTDGALESASATVTLTVADDATNTAPAWCPVEGCQREWRVPAMAPGGTLVVPVLDGWVDPEGDVLTLADAAAVRADDPVRALVTADGKLAIRHTDPNAGASEAAVMVTVRDSRGEETARELQISVEPDAQPEYTASATTIGVGETAKLAPLERVAGGSGSYALVDATVQSGPVTAAARTATGAIQVSADAAGTSTLSVVIRDTVTGGEVTGQLRVTAAPSGAPLELPPLRAFVRPLADATVEVLSAVPSAATRALAVSEAEVADGALSAEVIDHAQLRVSGATADGGPGRIGAVDVTVSEGDATTTGRLTVFQVPDTNADGAIAVPDAATVRTGSVVDVRVLDNDVAGPGERLVLHPDVVGSGAAGELAFASGNVLRYVAPDEPGTYRLSYTAYGASDPTKSDVGSVVVEVLAGGANREPQPTTLTARVSAGSTAELGVPLSGVDPDGDRVRLVSVTASEQAGLTAAIGASGTGITVTAADTMEPGVTRLGYTVRDPYGGSGTGSLNVIVLPGDAATGAPVVSTDYVRVTPDGDPAVVRPLENDVDPAAGALSVMSVVPNVVGGSDSAEYRALAERLDLEDMERGVVRITPGPDIGTVSYTYTVRSAATSSTADGLIVVQTSERVGVQAPSASDTVLNVRDRAALEAGGVDVVTDKVRWTTGDASQLELSLWESGASGYEVSGSRISGDYRPEGDTVIFRLQGEDSAGTEVSTFGLLVIPPLDELRLSLKPRIDPLQVDEDAAVEARVRDLVELGPGDEIEVRSGSYQTGRAQASCTSTSAGSFRYTAGTEAPWSDVCVVEARLVGQKQWTALPVPVAIRPDSPTVEAKTLTRTVAPGATEQIDLADMVSWEGDREGSMSELRYAVSGGGSLFEVSQRGGASVSVTARADGAPGSEEQLTVEVSGAGTAKAALTLRVGQAAQDLPRGGTAALRCTVGDPCQTRVIGLAGEHDPYAGKAGGGLEVTAVDGSGCAVASFSVSGNSEVAARWADAASVGGTCTVGFTVRDAQGRTGTGSIEFDALGLPSAPSIAQTGYTDTSASFTVTLGGGSHPAVSGVDLSGGGSTSCSAAGPTTFSCVATGLRNGEKHEFTARSRNAVGDSQPSNPVTAWAYRAPAAPTVTVTPVEWKNNDNPDIGRVRVEITGGDDVSQFQLTTDQGRSETLNGSSAESTFEAKSGQVSVTVTPVTRFEVPNIGTGAATGGAATVIGTVYGAPRLTTATLTSLGNNSAEVSYEGDRGGVVTASYALSKPFGAPPSNCSAGSGVFDGLKTFRSYTGKVCLTSAYGKSSKETNIVIVGGPLSAPRVTYTISPTPTTDATSAHYTLAGEPIVENKPDSTKLTYSNTGNQNFSIDAATPTPITVKQCTTGGDQVCSDDAAVNWVNAPNPVDVSLANHACYTDENASMTQAELLGFFQISSAAQGSATVTVGTPDSATQQVPMTISWTGHFSGLQAVTLNFCYTPPEPEPPTTP
ncbi:Ig-like domain-containing protein [Leucobacter allii]|uniref:Ig-like domain-containing protein n=1 Tax=Leucobacter allii TaxID=2932247 RepID=A0ABY4FN14_9MICO|nr:Ig-like domain-containing protein [Leucobacter allii]UOQ57661.1 Ig-like domain-containing protein [Leucobacter allii]